MLPAASRIPSLETSLLREALASPEVPRAYHVWCSHFPGAGRPMPM